MELKTSCTYYISPNGPAGDWYWEVIRHGKIMARGLAATKALARADAMTAARSHDLQPQDRSPPSKPDCRASS
jgi:hypothetical protein